MNQETIQKLNDLNKKFYSDLGEDFSSARQYYWQGWDKLVDSLEFRVDSSRLKVLDIGCGNGRFAKFLHENELDFEYTGIDFSQELLDIADQELGKLNLNYTLKNVDLLQEWDFGDKYDLIVMFGVLHHIAGSDNRQKIIRKLGNLLSESGKLVVTVWQFPLFDRFEKKVLPTAEILSKTGIDPQDLEENDYILDWFRKGFGFRYANYSDPDEMKGHFDSSNLKILDTFDADGREGGINKYYVVGGSKFVS